MQVVSVNVGQPREVLWKGRTVVTGIFKEPVKGRVRVRWENVDGDRQADLSVHGGRDKAVYLYPSEHYPAWRRELADMVLPWGVFGENLTTEGLLEKEVRIGDRFRVGSAELVVTQPRIPCFKLGVRFGRDDILKRFLESRRSGFYCAVAVEGETKAGDRIERIAGVSHGATVAEITRLYVEPGYDRSELLRVASLEGLPDSLRNHFANQARRLSRCEIERAARAPVQSDLLGDHLEADRHVAEHGAEQGRHDRRTELTYRGQARHCHSLRRA